MRTCLVLLAALALVLPSRAAPVPSPAPAAVDPVAAALSSKLAYISKQLGQKPVTVQPRNPKCKNGSCVVINPKNGRRDATPSLTTPAAAESSPATAQNASRITLARREDTVQQVAADRLERRYPPQFTGQPALNPKDPKNAGWATIPIKIIPTTGPILIKPIPIVINPKNAPTSAPKSSTTTTTKKRSPRTTTTTTTTTTRRK